MTEKKIDFMEGAHPLVRYKDRLDDVYYLLQDIHLEKTGEELDGGGEFVPDENMVYELFDLNGMVAAKYDLSNGCFEDEKVWSAKTIKRIK